MSDSNSLPPAEIPAELKPVVEAFQNRETQPSAICPTCDKLMDAPSVFCSGHQHPEPQPQPPAMEQWKIIVTYKCQFWPLVAWKSDIVCKEGHICASAYGFSKQEAEAIAARIVVEHNFINGKDLEIESTMGPNTYQQAVGLLREKIQQLEENGERLLTELMDSQQHALKQWSEIQQLQSQLYASIRESDMVEALVHAIHDLAHDLTGNESDDDPVIVLKRFFECQKAKLSAYKTLEEWARESLCYFAHLPNPVAVKAVKILSDIEEAKK